MLAGLGVATLIIGLYLKIVDKKKHLGLELPNVTDTATERAEIEESEVASAEG